MCPWAADRLPAGDFLNLTRVPDAELREIANGRGDLLAERAGVTLGFYARENGTSGKARHSGPRFSSLPVPT